MEAMRFFKFSILSFKVKISIFTLKPPRLSATPREEEKTKDDGDAENVLQLLKSCRCYDGFHCRGF